MTNGATSTKEPVAIGNAIGALIPLVAGATAAFEVWNPSPGQTGALTALYGGLLVVITLLQRKKVHPL